MSHYCLVLLSLTISSAYSAVLDLPYAEGGPDAEDPGVSLVPQLRRYIDVQDGDDGNNGTSPATAWKTLEMLIREKANLIPGTHVLFKRDLTWTGKLDFENVHGEVGKRLVLGTYGRPLEARAKILGTLSVSKSSHVMVRGFDCIKLDASAGAYHVVIYDNVVHGSPEINEYPSNGIRIFAESHHIAVVSNLVYDLGANDCIVVHPSATTNAADHHWILDNITIGNSGMEDGIDLAMSEPEKDPDGPVGRDIKVVGNRIMMQALPGLSVKTGRGSKCFSAGHEGKYIWVVGNTMGGAAHIGFKTGELKEYFQISGNVMFNCGERAGKLMAELRPRELLTEHNTFIHTSSKRAVLLLQGRNHRFHHNLVIRSQPDNQWATSVDTENLAEMDHNWYGHSSDVIINSMDWNTWVKSSGLDQRSGRGKVPGVTAPSESGSDADPKTWNSPGFIRHFIPQPHFGGCDGEATPGAFDCQGTRLGLEIKPMQGLENNGYGWEGPLLVQAKLKKIGVTFKVPHKN